MAALARDQRFEEAADVRDRAAALSGAIERQRRLDRLRRSGHVLIELARGGAELCGGRLVRSWEGDQPPLALGATLADPDQPVGREEVDELLCVARWLDERAGDLRLVHCDGGLHSPLPRLPTFAARKRRRLTSLSADG
jgi:hypothetical protein